VELIMLLSARLRELLGQLLCGWHCFWCLLCVELIMLL